MSIEESKEGQVIWDIGMPNKSAIFILPFLGNHCREFYIKDQLPQCQFRNCFIGDKTKNIKDKILLLYKFSPNELYLNFESLLEKHSLYDSKYEPDKKHTMFVFSVPEDKINDYNKLINGEYSKISNKTKENILIFHGLKTSTVTGMETNTGGVLYKTSRKRDNLEALINDGLDSEHWTRIPEDVELEEAFLENIECYQEKYKIKEAITPNQEFNI